MPNKPIQRRDVLIRGCVYCDNTMGTVNGRVHQEHDRKLNSTTSHDSDASLSTASVDFTITPPKTRKSVSFQELEDSIRGAGDSLDDSDGGLDSHSSRHGSLSHVPVPCPPRDSSCCCCCCCSDPMDKVDEYSEMGRTSPGHDLGYHTLVSRQTPTPTRQTPVWSPLLTSCPRGSSRPHLPPEQVLATYKGKRTSGKGSPFDRLCDDVILKIFSHLSTNQLCICARVCRRWYFLAWEPQLWTTIELTGEKTNADRALRTLARLLCRDSPSVCLTVEKVTLNGCSKLSDKGVTVLARRCPELRHLELKGCSNVSNTGILELVTNCSNLEHLDLTGCYQVNCIEANPLVNFGVEALSRNPHSRTRQLYLQYLDLTDCQSLEDAGLKVIVRACPQLLHLYLRRCVRISDSGVKNIATYCVMLRELSVSDCVRITDFGLYELAKLGSNLRYLSVAKCSQISDAGIKQIARHCYKLRYLNVRGCEAVSDNSMELLARSCPRLRALDIGKCDVTDHGLKVLSEHCPNLKKLSVKSCDMVSDKGVQSIAYYCRGLQQMNLQDCHVTLQGYRTVKKFCKRCIIEHTNPGFF